MVPRLAHALHMSTVVFYTLLFGTFIITSLVLGFALNRTLQYYSKKVPTEGGRSCSAFWRGCRCPFCCWEAFIWAWNRFRCHRKLNTSVPSCCSRW